MSISHSGGVWLQDVLRMSPRVPAFAVALAIALILSQLALLGEPRDSVETESSPGILEPWIQIVNWTDPHDGEMHVPLDKTVVIGLFNYSLSDTIEWTVSPDPGSMTPTWIYDAFDNPIIYLDHSDPFKECTKYDFNFTAYDEGGNPYDWYAFSFTSICGLSGPPEAPVLLSAVLGGMGNQDVILTWQLSADDGAGDDDVSHYAIYRSGEYDYAGVLYEFLASVPAGTSTFTHSFAGDGDRTNHFYYVQANDTSSEVNWAGQAGKFFRYLEQGKRFASVPLVQEDTNLEVVLQTLQGSFKQVRYYSYDESDPWKTYWTFKTYGDLSNVNRSMGFWIDMVKDDDLVVAGLVPLVTEIWLDAGWNMVGYPSFRKLMVGAALADVDWKRMEGFDYSLPYNLRRMNGTYMMRAGEGYWIEVDYPQIWEVSNVGPISPYIVWTDPADGEVDVPLNTSVWVKFSEEMNTSSVSWSISPFKTGLPYWWQGNTLLEIRYVLLTPFTTYGHMISGEDLDGNSLVPGPAPNPFFFNTVILSPYIVSTDPYDAEADVELDASLVIIFSEPMDTSSVQWTITPDEGLIWFESWSDGDRTLTLDHIVLFSEWVNYTMWVTDGKDLDGYDLIPGPVPNPWWFITAGGYPYILATDPFHGEIVGDMNRSIVVAFSEPMNTSSVTWGISPDPGGWSTDWLLSDTIMVLNHSNPFTPLTVYAVEITGGTDKDGNPLYGGAGPYQWSFVTSGCSCYIESTYPADGEVGVPVNASIIIEFSKPVDPSTFMFTILPDPGGLTFNWSPDLKTVDVTHAPFAVGTVYTVEVSVECEGGQALLPGPVPNPWEFTTGGDYPYIVMTDPFHLEVNVPVDYNITVTFSDPMNWTSVTFSIFPDPGGVQTIEWDASFTILWWNHTTPFVEATMHTITITGQDIYGRNLGPGPVPNPWWFYT